MAGDANKEKMWLGATGLTPTFTYYRNAETNANVAPPPVISEVGNGEYDFDKDTTQRISYYVDGNDGIHSFFGVTEAVDIFAAIARLLGVVYENSVLDDTTYDAGILTDATRYCYDSRANALTHDKSTGLIASYTIAATKTGDVITEYKVTLDP